MFPPSDRPEANSLPILVFINDDGFDHVSVY